MVFASVRHEIVRLPMYTATSRCSSSPLTKAMWQKMWHSLPRSTTCHSRYQHEDPLYSSTIIRCYVLQPSALWWVSKALQAGCHRFESCSAHVTVRHWAQGLAPLASRFTPRTRTRERSEPMSSASPVAPILRESDLASPRSDNPRDSPCFHAIRTWLRQDSKDAAFRRHAGWFPFYRSPLWPGAAAPRWSLHPKRLEPVSAVNLGWAASPVAPMFPCYSNLAAPRFERRSVQAPRWLISVRHCGQGLAPLAGRFTPGSRTLGRSELRLHCESHVSSTIQTGCAKIRKLSLRPRMCG